MDQILKKAKINKNSLKSTIVRIAAKELTQLSEPCHYPKFHKYQYDLYRQTNLTERDCKDFVSRFYKGTKWAKFLLIKDPVTNLLVVIMHYFLKQNDYKAYSYTMLFHMVRTYTNLMNRQIKFCNEDVFKYALEHLNKTHLFSREKTIPNAILFLSNIMSKKYEKYIKEGDVNKIGDFIQEARTRLSQSIKSFATLYYKASKEGAGVRSPYEGEEGEQNSHQYETMKKSERLIDEITKKITVYKLLDKKALTDAKTISKIKMSLATLIANSLTDIKYSDKIKHIYRLFIKDIKNINALCGKGYFTYVKRLMSLKRTNELVYFKQQVNVLLMLIIKEIKYEDKYNKVTSQSQFNINTFLAYYLTMIIRNSLCS